MIQELTIQQACSSPAAFMYVWAHEEKFLKLINPEYAKIIRAKKANQTKLLSLSAEKYLGSTSKVNQYTDAIRQAFIDAYGMTPAEALIILAQGGSVAGKNWAEGVFGIGATKGIDFGISINGQSVFVNKQDGHIYAGTTDLTNSVVYKDIKGQSVAYQLFARDVKDGDKSYTFMSQYDKKSQTYYAATYSNADGEFSATTGRAVTAADGADIWGNIMLIVQKFINWLISIFGGGKQTLSAENTLPNQSTDGFVQQAGVGESGVILMALLAGGALLMGGNKKKSSQSSK